MRRAGRPQTTKVALTIDQASLLDRRAQVVTIESAAIVNQQLQDSHVVTALSRACQRPQHAGTAARVQQIPHDLDVPARTANASGGRFAALHALTSTPPRARRSCTVERAPRSHALQSNESIDIKEFTCDSRARLSGSALPSCSARLAPRRSRTSSRRWLSITLPTASLHFAWFRSCDSRRWRAVLAFLLVSSDAHKAADVSFL